MPLDGAGYVGRGEIQWLGMWTRTLLQKILNGIIALHLCQTSGVLIQRLFTKVGFFFGGRPELDTMNAKRTRHHFLAAEVNVAQKQES